MYVISVGYWYQTVVTKFTASHCGASWGYQMESSPGNHWVHALVGRTAGVYLREIILPYNFNSSHWNQKEHDTNTVKTSQCKKFWCSIYKIWLGEAMLTAHSFWLKALFLNQETVSVWTVYRTSIFTVAMSISCRYLLMVNICSSFISFRVLNSLMRSWTLSAWPGL